MDLSSSDSSSDEEEEDHGATMMKRAMMVALHQQHLSRLRAKRTSINKGRRRGSKTVLWSRRSIYSIFNEYGTENYRRSYRMSQPSFWKLLDIIEGMLPEPRTYHGDVPNSVRLAIALRYFAGGDPLDLLPCSV